MDEIFLVLEKHQIDTELHEEGTKSITLIASTLNFNQITDLLHVGVKNISANTEGKLIIEA